jgi:hypothetical protein
MGDNSDPPQPYSNPQQTAQQQQQYNIGTAAAGQAASNVNQFSPFGSLQYTQNGTGPGGIPLYTATQSLSPQMQAIVNALQGGVTGQLQSANYGGQNASEAIGGPTSGLTEWMLNKQTSYMKPFFTQQQEQLDNQLRNQGIGPESTAYQRAMNNLSQSQNQSITGYLAQAAPTAQSMAIQNYMLPLALSSQEMGLLDPSMLTKSLVNPPQAQVAPVNYTGAVSDYNTQQMNAWKAQQDANTQMWSNIFRIPTSILGGWAGSPAGGAALTAGMAAI